MVLLVHDDARSELVAAGAWYFERNPHVAERFSAAVSELFDRICASPMQFPAWDSETRSALVEGFPFHVVFRLNSSAETVEILAVAHARRRPGYWRRRE